MKVQLLNKKSLAAAMGRGPAYVTAMCAAGYAMEFGTRTTLRHALNWLRANPQFRTVEYHLAHRGTKGRKSPGQDPQPATADKSCE